MKVLVYGIFNSPTLLRRPAVPQSVPRGSQKRSATSA